MLNVKKNSWIFRRFLPKQLFQILSLEGFSVPAPASEEMIKMHQCNEKMKKYLDKRGLK